MKDGVDPTLPQTTGDRGGPLGGERPAAFHEEG
jgi:hypothetical protein